MNVIINGRATVLGPDATVADAVGAATAAAPRGIAAAVNGEVVSRSLWADTELADGDRVEVLTAVQGG